MKFIYRIARSDLPQNTDVTKEYNTQYELNRLFNRAGNCLNIVEDTLAKRIETTFKNATYLLPDALTHWSIVLQAARLI